MLYAGQLFGIRIMQDPEINQPSTILYIEDNDDNIYMLSRRLERRAYTVQEARTGQSGLLLAKELLPALIIMDLILPDIDGWQATRQLKACATTRHIPIIALSANASIQDRESAIAAGCDDFDTKPVDFDRLLIKIESLLK